MLTQNHEKFHNSREYSSHFPREISQRANTVFSKRNSSCLTLFWQNIFESVNLKNPRPLQNFFRKLRNATGKYLGIAVLCHTRITQQKFQKRDSSTRKYFQQVSHFNFISKNRFLVPRQLLRREENYPRIFYVFLWGGKFHLKCDKFSYKFYDE